MKSNLKFGLILLLALTLVFAAYNFLVLKPSTVILERNIISDFESRKIIKTHLLENHVSRIQEGARSMSSRSMIRKKIIEYKAGRLTWAELQEFTKPKYIDGIKALENCTYALRIVGDSILVAYNNKPGTNVAVKLPDTLTSILQTSVFLMDTNIHVTVVSPIIFKGTTYGHDVIISKCPEIMGEIHDSTEQIKIVKNTHLRDYGVDKDSLKLSGILQTDTEISYYSKLSADNKYYHFIQSKNIVFSDLYEHVRRQYFTLLLILLVALLGVLIANKGLEFYFLEKSNILKALVKEKTSELNHAVLLLEESNQKLTASKKELIELNQTKDKFFSIIAHDLMSPIKTLNGLINLLYQRFDTYALDEIKGLIGKIKSGTDNTSRLLENLLTWSRLQKGKIDFSTRKIDYRHMVSQSIELLKLQTDKKSQLIQNKIPEGFDIYGDENMLRTVNRNLLSNAIKFSPEKSTIEIGIHNVNSSVDENNTTVYVKDSGVGIEAAAVSKLFSISEAMSTKGTNNEPGTGLGLVLCKEFIDLHKGEIWVESEPGKGTTFYYSIPNYS